MTAAAVGNSLLGAVVVASLLVVGVLVPLVLVTADNVRYSFKKQVVKVI